eukprot:CAMPEP_0202963286 /NCGR_PEP_ID=MMETSP1396-20130829/7271_1 /ASSEMBLY_ACC=CAM_ASM_000872 /TAXON_ID= /ORGANISM="Pseudokeronopsis sp., Strain Brazil" /LENGTH=59 /DNA_ID=CAMNT_0049684363 /DNA_START=273 /DNA_END=452 /DNA_ORIENTATION=-
MAVPEDGACTLTVDRWDNGSYGTVRFPHLPPQLYAFHSNNQLVEEGEEYGLTLSATGWD